VSDMKATFAEGDLVVAKEDYRADYGYSGVNVRGGTVGRVIRVNKRTYRVAWEEYYAASGNRQTNVPEDVSCTFRQVRAYDPSTDPRPLGVAPEDGFSIGVDDPRLQWLWEDLAVWADNSTWCSQYETLAESFGIPGREKNFRITVAAGVVVSVRARSRAEAVSLAEARVRDAAQLVASEIAPSS
jgi:hypothetical protein